MGEMYHSGPREAEGTNGKLVIIPETACNSASEYKIEKSQQCTLFY